MMGLAITAGVASSQTARRRKRDSRRQVTGTVAPPGYPMAIGQRDSRHSLLVIVVIEAASAAPITISRSCIADNKVTGVGQTAVGTRRKNSSSRVLVVYDTSRDVGFFNRASRIFRSAQDVLDRLGSIRRQPRRESELSRAPFIW